MYHGCKLGVMLLLKPAVWWLQGNSRIELVDLIIYHSRESAVNLLKLRLTKLKNMGIRASYWYGSSVSSNIRVNLSYFIISAPERIVLETPHLK